MTSTEIMALAAGSMFTAGVAFFTAARVPKWRTADTGSFLPQFARALTIADKVQPALLVATVVAASVLSASASGSEGLLAGIAAAGFAAVLLGSAAFLVPLQRRIISTGRDPGTPLAAMRARWITGQVVRTIISVASLALLVAAVLGLG